MKYTIEEFHADVAAEAKALRQHATKEELKELDIRFLDTDSKYNCIYGLLTGHCNSKRAIALIEQCCTRFIKDNNLADIVGGGFERIAEKINGSVYNGSLYDNRNAYIESIETHYSSIEAYILLPEANNVGLIAYLRGETDDLVL